MATQLEIANLALVRMSHSDQIASLTENSQERVILDAIWDMARVSALRNHPWGFATFVAKFLGQASKISLVSDTYKWTASTTVNEFYLELAAGGDPGLVDPTCVLEGGTQMVRGTLGSLAASEWSFGDNDAAITFDTVYVRLDDNGDPDDEVDGHIQYVADPEWDYVYDLPTGFLQAVYVVDPGNLKMPSDIPFETRGGLFYTDEKEAQVKYIKDITDPAAWDVSFSQAFSWWLAADFAAVLTGSLQRQQQLMANYEVAKGKVRVDDAQNNRVTPSLGASILESRN